MNIKIETERLLLREIEPEDKQIMLLLHNNPAVQTFLGEKYPVQESFISYIIKNIWQREYREYGHGRWAVVSKEDGGIMGWAGLKYIKEYSFVDLGYRFFPEYWGKGIATECSIPLVKYGFEDLDLNEIWGMAWYKNKASIKILEKTRQ